VGIVSELEQKRPWWQSFITPQNIIAIIFAVFAAGGYWQETKHQQLRNDQQDQRMDRIEKQRAEDRAEVDRLYMRRETMESELRTIRVEIQGLRRDLR
jgi:hypothetical protein